MPLSEALTPVEDLQGINTAPLDMSTFDPNAISDIPSVGTELNPSAESVSQPVSDYAEHDPNHPEYLQPTDATPPSPKQAKFLKYNEDGSALFSNGVSKLSNGSIRWEDKDTGTIFEQKNPYVKAVTIGKKQAKPDYEADAAKAAANKGVVPELYANREEYLKARQQALNPNSGVDDVSTGIAEAIISGEQPPDLKGMYRHGPGIKKALHDKGYNLTDAQLDWQATQKHISTMEGPQQLRMRQAIDNSYHSLDVIDDLANQWDAGKFPLLNKVRLESAKQGVLGPEAQKIAVQLEAQIADVTSELGNVYMGGNSPTDHSLKLAQSNLSSSWSRQTLKAATDLARKNLVIRDNSIKNSGTSREGNRYDQGKAPDAVPTAQPSATPFHGNPDAESIKEAFRTGKMTREQARAALQALGQ